MDTPINYPAQIPLDTDVSGLARQVVRALGQMLALTHNQSAALGLTAVPASAGLGVEIYPGTLVQLQTLAPVASGSLPVDATQCYQQGINDGTTGPVVFSGTGTWTVYGSVQVAAANQQVLPFYNPANPAQTFAGENNSNGDLPTEIQATVVFGATQGAIPAGSVALYVVTVPGGATAVTQDMITQSPGIFWFTIPQLQAAINAETSRAETVEAQIRPGRLLATQIFTTTSPSFTYEPTQGTNLIRVTAVGGGGSGGGAPATTSSQISTASGGASGSWGVFLLSGPYITATQIIVGTGGIGQSGSTGQSGNPTQFGSVLSFPGGGFGASLMLDNTAGNATSLRSTPNGAPSVGAGVDTSHVNTVYASAGFCGTNGFIFTSPVLSLPGIGGSSPYGAGGGNVQDSSGVSGSGYGAGGGGTGSSKGSSPLLGGSGSPGWIMIEEYS